jgi:hypothetical protein
MLTFEGAPLQGRASIGEKLTVRFFFTLHIRSVTDIHGQSLPFQKVAHQVDTLDAQPSSEQGGILVMVTGKLKVMLSNVRTRILLTDHSLRPMMMHLKASSKFSSYCPREVATSSSTTNSDSSTQPNRTKLRSLHHRRLIRTRLEAAYCFL